MIRACWLPSKRELTCPMHGPHAFASTMAPTSSSAEVNPSRSIVARICSEPGVHRNGTYHIVKILLSVPTCLHHRCPSLVIEDHGHAFACRPAAFACLARSAARVWIKRVITCHWGSRQTPERSKRNGTYHILIRAVGARPDKRRRNLILPSLFLDEIWEA